MTPECRDFVEGRPGRFERFKGLFEEPFPAWASSNAVGQANRSGWGYGEAKNINKVELSKDGLVELRRELGYVPGDAHQSLGHFWAAHIVDGENEQIEAGAIWQKKEKQEICRFI